MYIYIYIHTYTYNNDNSNNNDNNSSNNNSNDNDNNNNNNNNNTCVFNRRESAGPETCGARLWTRAGGPCGAPIYIYIYIYIYMYIAIYARSRPLPPREPPATSRQCGQLHSVVCHRYLAPRPVACFSGPDSKSVKCRDSQGLSRPSELFEGQVPPATFRSKCP